MDKIIKRDGFVYLVKGCDRKGFETFYKLGKDIDDPRWSEEVKEMEIPKEKKGRTKKDTE